jgi:hypothetical protein
MAGDAAMGCEVASWVAAVDVIHVSSLCLCGGETCGRPADVAGPCQHGRGTVSSVPGSHNRQFGRDAIDLARRFLCVLGREARAHGGKPIAITLPCSPGGKAGNRGGRRGSATSGMCRVRPVQAVWLAGMTKGRVKRPRTCPSYLREMGPAVALLSW